MKILVANLGSTSFKYRLFDMTTEKVLARGGVERIGAPKSRSYAQTERGSSEKEVPVPDHAAAVEACLHLLADPRVGVLKDSAELTAIGFKAVHAQQMTGVRRVDGKVLAAMEAYNDVAPAHNPPYVRAMRLLAEKLPQIPLVAAFESGFDDLSYFNHAFKKAFHCSPMAIRQKQGANSEPGRSNPPKGRARKPK